MEQTAGRPTIIEFNGLPGCGKTTSMIEIRKRLKHLDVRELNANKLIECAGSRKEILFSKELRSYYFLFLRLFFLIKPVTRERYRMLQMTFRYWCGIKNARSKGNKPEICILDQGVIQGFVSVSYQGNIKNEKKWLTYIKKIMGGLDNVIYVNCEIDPAGARTRMKGRKKKISRLYLINNDQKLDQVLFLQNCQFGKIRTAVSGNAVKINMYDTAEDNAKKIVSYYLENKLTEGNKK